MQVGKLSRISRYPVKSFAGEDLQSCLVESYGLYGDRFCAFRDETKTGWDSYITARDIPGMLDYKAGLVGEEIRVQAPDGKVYGWNEELLKEIQVHTSRKLSMMNYNAPNLESPELKAVDLASIHIITNKSLQKLEALWGQSIDIRRFRANYIIEVEDHVDESDWIGKQLRIGDSIISVDSLCERCSIITINPVSLYRDSTLLRSVHERMDSAFGVYASVVKVGNVSVGDGVYEI